jgi:hypothetical protein
VAAEMVAAGAVNGTLKYTVGRERPNASDHPWSFRPGALDNRWQSFP